MLKLEEAVLRKKMLGVLLRHARQRANLTLRYVADRVGSSPATIADTEYGRRDVSLAELEIFAHLYHTPIAYFWTEQLPDEQADGDLPVEALLGLRRRIIGVLLRQARLEAGRSQEELAQLLDCPPTRIAGYEFGHTDIPLLELEHMASLLGVPMSYFFDEGIKPGGDPLADMEELKQLAELPADVRRFMLQPGNALYMRAAMHLSALPSSTLRRLAEGLLDITY
jgi:transcriptional regulator with XRE-family HTH domain